MGYRISPSTTLDVVGKPLPYHRSWSCGGDPKPRRNAALAVSVIVLALTAYPSRAQDGGKTYQGLTRPSRDVDLVLRVSGVLAKLPVAAGQEVKRGELVAELKSELERQSLDIARLKAESDHEIRLAMMQLKLKKTELRQYQELEAKQAASKWEVETTAVEVELAEVRVDTTQFDMRIAGLDYHREQLLLAERKLLAPFDGVILRTLKEEGEGVADLEPIAVLVRLDPIWVECHLPPELFSRIHVGTHAVVKSAGSWTEAVAEPGESSDTGDAHRVTREGVIVAADPLVDAASDTFRIVIEVPNSDGALVAGVLATARFPVEANP